jgi:hypothetical protein
VGSQRLTAELRHGQEEEKIVEWKKEEREKIENKLSMKGLKQ